jgi:ABC-type lipoprotein export system ATPase subunit
MDIEAIRESIEGVRVKLSRAKPGRLTQQEEMLVFYVGELINLFDKIDELAAPLRNFARLINKYLSPVKTARLRPSDNRIIILDRNEVEIEPDQLSSGEKQILAFFAFLLLKSSSHFTYIIIDEPELSLSVSWQKTLMGDIAATSRSEYIVAATHSPFIFERFSFSNVLSLGEL